MDDYLVDLPPSLGWLRAGNWHRVHHLVTRQVGDEFITLCGRRLSYPLTAQFPDGVVRPKWLCKNCRRRIDKWRSANAAELK